MKLETERLILREFRTSDAEKVNEYSSKPEVVKYVPFGPNKLSETKKFITRCISARKKKPRAEYHFAITLKENGKLIGGCTLAIQSFENRKAHIGYMINPKFQRQGYATELTQALIKFGFTKLKLQRIFGSSDIRNIASWKVMEKCGMKREAHLRHNVKQHGKWRDSYIYAILIGDYKKKK